MALVSCRFSTPGIPSAIPPNASLVAGDVDGKIDKLFKKVAKTQEKSKFDVS